MTSNEHLHLLHLSVIYYVVTTIHIETTMFAYIRQCNFIIIIIVVYKYYFTQNLPLIW